MWDHPFGPSPNVKGYLAVTYQDGQGVYFPPADGVNRDPSCCGIPLCVAYRLISGCVMDHRVSFVLSSFCDDLLHNNDKNVTVVERTTV